MSEDFDFSDEVRGLQMPTLVVAADADMARRVTTSKCSNCSGAASAMAAGWARGGQKAVTHSRSFPGQTHYNIFNSPLFAAATLAFLEESNS